MGPRRNTARQSGRERPDGAADPSGRIALFEAALDSMSEGVMVVDAGLQVQIASGQVNRLIGLPADIDLVGMQFPDVVALQRRYGSYGPDGVLLPPEVRRSDDAPPHPAHAPPRYQRRLPDGRTIEIRTRAIPGGGWVRTYIDVSDLEETRRRAAESQTMLREIVDSLDAALVVYDRDDRFVMSNRRFHEIYPHHPPDSELVGRSFEDLLRKTVADGIFSSDEMRRDPERQIARLVAARKEWRNDVRVERWDDGRVDMVRRTVTANGYRISIRIDVTEREGLQDTLAKADQRARESEALLREVMESIDASIVVFDADDRFVLANQRYHEVHPHLPPDDQLVGRSFEDILRMTIAAGRSRNWEPGEDAEAFVARRLRERRDQSRSNWIARNPDGRADLVRNTRTPSGRRITMRVDITEQQDLMDRLTRAETEARETAALMREVIDSLDGSLVVHDKDDRFVMANKRYHELYPHFPPDSEMVGTTFEDNLWATIKAGIYVTELARDNPEEFVRRRMIERAKFVERGQVIVAPSGRTDIVRMTVTPNGRRISLRVDISEQVRLQEELERSRQQMRAIAANLPGAIFRLERHPDGALAFAYISDGIEALTGAPPDAIVGKPEHTLDIVPEPYRARLLSELAESVAKESPVNFEYDLRRPGGETWVRVLTQPRRDASGTIIWDGLLLDSTEWKKADQAKRAFVSTVSHELRTPLTAIRGSLGLIAGGAMGALPERAKRLIDIANTNSIRLTRLINDILDIEKIESDGIDFAMEPLDLAGLIERSVDANRGFGIARGVEIDLEDLPQGCTVRVDADRFTQVMTNLLSNAMKFSPDGGRVTVGVARQDRRVRISVTDRGPGIPPEFRPRMFQRFSQANTRDDRARGGTGLGLSIAKAIVERFAGRIGFDTEQGVGTTLWFDLPLVVPVPADAEIVLVVEDDPALAEVYQLALAEAGMATLVSHTAADALAQLAQRPIAAIMLDLLLPDRDGLSLLAEVRADPRHAGLPVIVVSGRADEAGRSGGAAALGVHAWVRKPVDAIALADLVRAAVVRRRDTGIRILHVEDDPSLADLLEQALGGVSQVVNAASLAAARAHLRDQPFDLVILDLGLPDGSGIDLLGDLATLDGHALTPVLLLSATEPDRGVTNRVARVLTKSKVSMEAVVEVVRSMLVQKEQPQ